MQMNSQTSWRRFSSGLALAALAVFGLAGPTRAAEGGAASPHSPAAPASATAGSSAKMKTSTIPTEQQIDINSASRERLKTLPGIGNAEADKIIAGRPYYSKTDLVIRNILPESSYAAIKYRVLVGPVAKPKSKK
jgi:DNA uptake protein ComE-like DNA-binding protein